MEEKFNKRLLSKDLQKQNPLKKLCTISLYYYCKFIKSHPIELKQALDDILPSNYLSCYEEYFRNQKEEKSNKTSKSKKSNRKHSKDNKDKLFDNELFYNEDEEIKLTFDRACTLKRWTDLAALFSETVEQLKHGKRKVNLKKYNTFKRSSWIKLFIKNERTAYAKNKQAKAPVEHKPYDDMNILKSDLEFLEEFLDVSNEDDDESNEEKALLSSTLNKSDNAYSGSSDQLADNADTYVFLVELLNECIECEMPDDFEIIKKIKTGIDHFENFHKEYRSFFNYQRDVVKFSKNLIPIKSSQPYFSTESVQKLVDKGKSKKHIIPLNNEISDLEFYLMQYEEFKHEYMNECLDIVSSLTKETSFADDPKCDRASFIFNQVKFLPLLCEADEELLTKIWCISWMKKVDELINDIRKRSLSEWTQLADEISTIECDSVLSGYPSYEDFKTNYSCGYDIYNILYNKKTKAYKIYPNELGHIIEVCNNCKIYLEEEIEQLTHEVEKFKKTDALLIEMINNREFLSKFNDLKLVFEDSPCICNDECELISELNKNVEDIKTDITECFESFDIIRRAQRGITKEDSFKQKKDAKSPFKKIKNINKGNAKGFSVASMAERRKERINTIEDSPSRKSKERKSSRSNQRNKKEAKPSQSCEKSLDDSDSTKSKSVKSKSRERKSKEHESSQSSLSSQKNPDQSENESSNSCEEEPLNSLENAMRIKEDYLKLQCKFEEGELFLQKLENEISQYSKARDLLCAIEKQLDNLDDVSFYTSKPVHDSIPFDIHKIVFSDPKVYFTYDPQITFSASKSLCPPAILSPSLPSLPTSTSLLSFLLLIWSSLPAHSFLVSFPSLSPFHSLISLRLFLLIYQLQMLRPRLPSSSLLLKEEIDLFFKNPKEKTSKSEGNHKGAKIDMDCEWFDKGFMGDDVARGLREGEMETLRNVANEVYGICEKIGEVKKAEHLDAFRELIKDNLIVDFSQVITQCKNRIRRKMGKSTVKKRKISEEEDSQEYGSWVLRIDCKKRVKKEKAKLNKRKTIY